MRLFYLSHADISPTLSANSKLEISPTVWAKSVDSKLKTDPRKLQTRSANLQLPSEKGIESLGAISAFFPLPWSDADTAQMRLYLNYAREHWTYQDENPPVGLIICAKKDEAVAHYSLEGLPNKVMAAEYRMALPDEKLPTAELEKTQSALELQAINSNTSRNHPRPGRTAKKAIKRTE